MADELKGRRTRSAFQKRAALRKRAIADQETPETTGPHGIAEDIAVAGLPLGGLAGEYRAGKAAAKVVARGLQRRAAVRAASAASERRLAEMAAPRAARVLKARGGGLLTDVLGTPTHAETAFNEAKGAADELGDAIVSEAKKRFRRK